MHEYHALVEEVAYYQGRMDRLSDRIKVLQTMREGLQSRSTDAEKVGNFIKQLNDATNKGGSLAANDKRVKRFLRAVGYMMATIITLGVYAEVRAKHALNTRGTMQFWQGKRAAFSSTAKKRLHRYAKLHSKK